MKILYKNLKGNLVVIKATTEWLSQGTMEELAQKDVPTGFKYKIVDDSVIPNDRSFRNAWEVDEAELTDGVGA